MTKKKFIPEAIPTLEIPIKSHAIETVTKPIVQDISPVAEKHSYVGRVKNLKSLNAWNTTILETKLIFQKPSECYNTITLDDGLGFSIQVYDCYIPQDHTIYKMYRRSMKNISVPDLIQIVRSYNICPGINYIKDDASIYFHVFPLNNDDTNDNEDEPLIP